MILMVILASLAGLFLCVSAFSTWRYWQTRTQLQILQVEHKAHIQSNAQLQTLAKESAQYVFEHQRVQMRQQQQEHIQDLLLPLREQLKTFETKVDDVYGKESRERFALKQEITRLATLNHKISEEAVQLTQALTGQKKTQGMWGELMLERLLEQAGLQQGREYALQVNLKDSDGATYQPDAVIYLPDDKHIVIDAKVSLNAYQRYYAAVNEDDEQLALSQHIAAIRGHIKSLSAKPYTQLQGLNTLDFMLMFIPIEAAFALAVQKEPELITDAIHKNLIIVTPSSLLATLRTISHHWRLSLQNKHAQIIAEKGGQLYDKFVGFTQDLLTVGEQLKTTEKTYQNAMNKLTQGRGNLVGRAQALKELGAKVSKTLPTQLVYEEDDVSAL